MDVYFPNVIMDGTHSNTWYVPPPEQGYRLSGTWKQYHHGSSLYRFGTAGAKGVCPVFPPEMFSQMDSITQIQGDSPNCVEYWIEKLKAEPHGEYWDFHGEYWYFPRHNKSDYGIAQ